MNLPKKPNLTRIFAVLLIVFFGVFVFALPARAWNPVEAGMLFVAEGLINAMKYVLGWFFNLAALLILALLNVQKFTTMPIVQTGWTIVRNFTNMFFALGLLAIAFATILRLEAYGYKKLLAKLIIAALLVNFSLVLVAPLIDFAQLLTNHFLIELGGKNLANSLAEALRVRNYDKTIKDKGLLVGPEEGRAECYEKALAQGIDCTKWWDFVFRDTCAQCQVEYNRAVTAAREQDKANSDNLDNSISSAWKILVGSFMSCVFIAIATFCLGLFAFFLIVRMIYIWVLLILSPIVWLMWVFPATQRYFSQWWGKFLNWVFFAPIYMFFVYLAITSYPTLIEQFDQPPEIDPVSVTQTQGEAREGGAIAGRVAQANNGNGPVTKTDPTLPDLFQWKFMIQFLVVVGLLVGGLMAAQALGVAGAAATMKFAKNAGQKVSGYSAARGRYERGRAVRRKVKGAKQQRKAELRRVAGPTQWMRERFRPTAGGRAEARAERQASVKKEAMRMGDMYDMEKVRKTAGRRRYLPRMFRHGNVEREAAQALLADPESAAYQSAEKKQQVRVDKEQRKIERLERGSRKKWYNPAKPRFAKRRIWGAQQQKKWAEEALESKEERKERRAREIVERQEAERGIATGKETKKWEKAEKKLEKRREREKRMTEEYKLPSGEQEKKTREMAEAYEELQKGKYEAPPEEA